MVTLSLIKETGIYSGENTASSISGAGKTGQVQDREKERQNKGERETTRV